MNLNNKSTIIATTALFASLTAIGSYISIPTGLIPFTFQVFFVLLSGVILGPKLGPLSQIIYVGVGIAGFPVFASGNAGPGVLIGPTGGYLIGFIVASFVVGLLSSRIDRRKNKFKLFGISLAGIPVIYLFGLLNLLRFQPLQGAFVSGVAPFIPLDIVKAFLVSIVVLKLPRSVLISSKRGNPASS